MADLIPIDADDLESWNIAPQADWSEMSATEHFVQFYEADRFLLNSLSGFIGAAIDSGDAAVVLATKAHQDGLDEILVAKGFDLTTARANGRYITLDAADTLAKFMVDGLPEATRFHEVFGRILSSVTDGRSQVRAFGEMVALLWTEGNYNGAIRLEELWNDLQKAYSFSLFCAYPMHGFASEKLAQSHHGVCSVHTRVIPAESYGGLEDQDERLRAIARLQQLEAEIAMIRRAFPDLGGAPRRGPGRPAASAAGAVPTKRRRRRRMSAEGRKRISEMMKKRWAERRKAKK